MNDLFHTGDVKSTVLICQFGVPFYFGSSCFYYFPFKGLLLDMRQL